MDSLDSIECLPGVSVCLKPAANSDQQIEDRHNVNITFDIQPTLYIQSTVDTPMIETWGRVTQSAGIVSMS